MRAVPPSGRVPGLGMVRAVHSVLECEGPIQEWLGVGLRVTSMLLQEGHSTPGRSTPRVTASEYGK